MARATVLYSGDVQGVGFRFTARAAARGFAITGYVRNRPDGSVEVLAEGTRPEIEAFLGQLYSLMERNISDLQINWSDHTGEFREFSVRF